MRTRLCVANVVVLLSCKKTAPLGQSGGAASLEMSAVYVATILIEVAKYGGVDGGKFLQTSQLLNAFFLTLAAINGLDHLYI